MAIGDANAIIPLYINKNHWKIIKIYLKQTLELIISYNPFIYSDNHKNLFFIVFLEMINKIFEKDFLNEKFIKCLICLLRTCAEICFEEKFNYGIKNLIFKYLNNPIERISKTKYPYD